MYACCIFVRIDPSSLSISSDRPLSAITHSLTLFSGPTEEPSIYCPGTVTTRKGTPVTLRCAIMGNPKPRVTFLKALHSVGNTAPLQTRTSVSKSQSDNPNNWVDSDIDGQWQYNLTITPQQNESYLCTATNSINEGWGNREVQARMWINVTVTDEWEHVSFMHLSDNKLEWSSERALLASEWGYSPNWIQVSHTLAYYMHTWVLFHVPLIRRVL